MDHGLLRPLQKGSCTSGISDHRDTKKSSRHFHRNPARLGCIRKGATPEPDEQDTPLPPPKRIWRSVAPSRLCRARRVVETQTTSSGLISCQSVVRPRRSRRRRTGHPKSGKAHTIGVLFSFVLKTPQCDERRRRDGFHIYWSAARISGLESSSLNTSPVVRITDLRAWSAGRKKFPPKSAIFVRLAEASKRPWASWTCTVME